MNPFQPWSTVKDALTAPKPPRSGANDDRFTEMVGGGPPCDPTTNADCSALFGFPGSCYYFGQVLSDALANASASGTAPPIGLINTAWGGSSIEEWLSNDTQATCEYVKLSSLSAEFYDTRVLPYIGQTVRGWLWYQASLHSPKTDPSPLFPVCIPAVRTAAPAVASMRGVLARRAAHPVASSAAGRERHVQREGHRR